MEPDAGGWISDGVGFLTQFPESLAPDEGVTTSFDSDSLAAILEGADSGHVHREGVSGLVYADALPNVDLHFEALSTGHKETIVLRSPEAPATFVYRIVPDGVELREASDGSIEVVDDEEVVGTFPVPYAEDNWTSEPRGATGNRTYDVGTTLTTEADGSYLLRYDLPQTWLQDPGRVYPVGLDPSFVTSNDEAPLLKDTWARTNDNSTHHNDSFLRVGTDAVGKAAAYMTFDIRQRIRPEDIVYSATLRLKGQGASSPNGTAVEIRRIRQHWEETQITGSNRPDVAQGTVYATGVPKGTENNLFNVTSLVQFWADYEGPVDPESTDGNHGLAVEAVGTEPWIDFGSKESANSPYLEAAVNTLPNDPEIVSPTHGAIVGREPTLEIDEVSDFNSDPVYVKFEISSSRTFQFTGVWSSSWTTERSIQVPAGKLKDDTVYYWRVLAADYCGKTSPYRESSDTIERELGLCDTRGLARPVSKSRAFVVNPDQRGDDARYAMWRHPLGNGMRLAVNEANGNVLLRYPVASFGTPRDALDISLTYNSHSALDDRVTGAPGLPAGWDLAAGAGLEGDYPIRLDANSPDESGRIVYASGRREAFVPLAYRSPVYVQVGPGANTIWRVNTQTPNQWLMKTDSGSLYTFNAQGILEEARILTSDPSSPGLAYDFDVEGLTRLLTRVEDPFGRSATFTYTQTTPRRLTSIRVSGVGGADAQTWDLDYVVGPFSAMALMDITGPPRPDGARESVKLEYDEVRLTGVAQSRYLLRKIWDGAHARGSEWSTRISYQNTMGYRVATAVELPQVTHPWSFSYSGLTSVPNGGKIFSNTTTITDPRGASTPGQDFETEITFNEEGLPTLMLGPDLDGERSQRVMRWDEHRNLLCERSGTANLETSGDCPAPNPKDSPDYRQPATGSDGRNTEYFYRERAPFLLEKVIGPDPSDSGARLSNQRLVTDYRYDEGLNGLRAQIFANPDLRNMPKAEAIYPTVDVDWGTGSPGELGSQSDDWSLRLYGEIHADHASGRQAYGFKLRHQDDARLIIGEHIVTDLTNQSLCWSDRSDVVVNCDQGQKFVKLSPGWHPITIELTAKTGPAELHLDWQKPSWSSGRWESVPTDELRPVLNTLTSTRVGTLQNPTEFSLEERSYDTDLAKLRGLPREVSLSGPNTVARRVSYSYDKFWRVKQETDATGVPVVHDYSDKPDDDDDSDDGPCEERSVDRVGLVIERQCDSWGRMQVEKQMGVEGVDRVSSISYDAYGRITTTTRPDGGVTRYLYDLAGRLERKEQTVAPGEPDRVWDYDYDHQGRLLTKTLPDRLPNDGRTAPVVSFTYDAVDNVTEQIDERGELWTRGFNALNLPTSRTTPDGDVWRNGYDAAGTLRTRETPWHVITSFVYDILGRKQSQTTKSAAGQSLAPRSWRHDAIGNVVEVIDPDGVKQTMTYDAAGDVRTETMALKQSSDLVTRTSTYDGSGFLDAVSNYCVSASGCPSTTFTQDNMGRVKTVTLPHGAPNVTHYNYNAAGELTQVSIPREGGLPPIVLGYSHDAMGRLAAELPNNRQDLKRGYDYDLAGELTGATTPVDSKTFTYDGHGNLLRRESLDSDGALMAAEAFDYDDAGNMLVANGGGQAISIGYDGSGRLSSVEEAGLTTNFGYQDGRLFRRSDLKSPDAPWAGDVTLFDYDPFGRLASIQDQLTGGTTTFSYKDSGRMASRSDPNGLSHHYSYEAGSGRFGSEELRRDGTAIGSYAQSYDQDGHVATRTQDIPGSPDNGTWSFSYDDAGRLTKATEPGGDYQRYEYDPAGNRTKVASTHPIASGQEVTTEVSTDYNEASQPVASSDGTTYSHDGAGNLIEVTRGGVGWHYSYDGFDRLATARRVLPPAALDDPLEIAYRYDALGRTVKRVRRLVSAAATTPVSEELIDYLGTSQEPVRARLSLADVDRPVEIETHFAYGADHMIAQREKITTELVTGTEVEISTAYIGTNPHGDLAYLSDPDGELSGFKTYGAWGEERSEVGLGSTLGYQSDPTDADTGLIDMGARLYMPSLGRFTTLDPAPGDVMSPLSLNENVYGWDDPLTNIDPDGRYVVTTHGSDRDCPDSDCTREQHDNYCWANPLADGCQDLGGNWFSNNLVANRVVDTYLLAGNWVLHADYGTLFAGTVNVVKGVTQFTGGLVLTGIGVLVTPVLPEVGLPIAAVGAGTAVVGGRSVGRGFAQISMSGNCVYECNLRGYLARAVRGVIPILLGGN